MTGAYTILEFTSEFILESIFRPLPDDNAIINLKKRPVQDEFRLVLLVGGDIAWQNLGFVSLRYRFLKHRIVMGTSIMICSLNVRVWVIKAVGAQVLFPIGALLMQAVQQATPGSMKSRTCSVSQNVGQVHSVISP